MGPESKVNTESSQLGLTQVIMVSGSVRFQVSRCWLVPFQRGSLMGIVLGKLDCFGIGVVPVHEGTV